MTTEEVELRDGKVVDLSEFKQMLESGRRRLRELQKLPGTRLLIEISPEGDIDFPPPIVQRAHAMALLKLMISYSDHLVDLQLAP